MRTILLTLLIVSVVSASAFAIWNPFSRMGMTGNSLVTRTVTIAELPAVVDYPIIAPVIASTVSMGGNSSPSNIFSPDGERIVIAKGGVVQILETESGKVLQTLQGPTPWIFTAAFSPDGKKIIAGGQSHATVGQYNIVQVWCADSGKELHRLEGHTAHVYSAVFSPDSEKIVTAGPINAIIWDAESGEKLHQLEVSRQGSCVAIFSPDGRKIVTTEGIVARVWDAESGQELHALPWMQSIGSSITFAAFSLDGKKIVTSGEHFIRIWDAETGKELRMLQRKPYEPGRFYGSAIEPGFGPAAFSPDGKKVLASNWDGTLRIWDAESGKELQRMARAASPFATFSPDGQKIIVPGFSHNEHSEKGWFRK